MHIQVQWLCEYVDVYHRGFWLGRQVFWTTNIVCRLLSNQGLLTRLVNTLTKTEPKHTPIPKPRSPKSRLVQVPKQQRWIWPRTSNGADAQHKLAPAYEARAPEETDCDGCRSGVLSPSLFACDQLTLMRTVGLDRKPCLLCYCSSAIITQEVCLSWPQPP